MKKLVVYCHGYNSSAKTDKVDALRNAGFETYAWDIDIDPDVSIPALEHDIDNLLVGYLHHDVDLVFVGTSLGAWYASRLADKYNARAILINPAYNPANTLPKVGCDPTTASKYTPISIGKNDDLVYAKDDELIDHCRDWPEAKSITVHETGGHRFNGKQFETVFKLI